MDSRVKFKCKFFSKFVFIMFASCHPVASVPDMGFNVSRLLNEHEKICRKSLCSSLDDVKVIVPCDDVEHCYQCQCDKDCTAYDDCCPQLLPLTELIPPTAERVCISEKMKTGTFYRMVPASYYMINSCPSGKNVHDVVVTNGFNNTSPVAYPPVTSLDTSETYTNMFCAICNNDTHYTEWDVDFSCSFGIVGKTTNSSDRLMDLILSSEDCTIGIKVKAGIYPRPCLNVHVISECNVTGLWLADDKFLRHACNVYKNVYMHPTGAYRNVFCLICNGYEHSRNLGFAFCGEDHAMTSMEKVKGVFDVSIIRQSMKVASTKCPPGFWYDPFMRTCLRVYCSMGRVYDGNACKSIIKQADGLKYKVKLSVKVDRHLAIDDMDRIPYFEEMYNEFERYIDDVSGDRDELNGLFIQNNYKIFVIVRPAADQNIFQNIILESSAIAYIKFVEVEMDVIEETLLNNTNLDFTFHSTVINETVRSTVKLVTEFVPIMALHYNVSTTYRILGEYYIDFSLLSSCPHLEMSDFQIVGDLIFIHGLNSSLTTSDVIILNNTMRMCKSDYEDVIKPHLPSAKTVKVATVVNGQTSDYNMVNLAVTSVSLVLLTLVLI